MNNLVIGAQGLASVDDEERPALRIDAARDQVGEQTGAHGRILRRAFVQTENGPVASLVDSERDEDNVLAEVDPVDHDDADGKLGQVATHRSRELLTRRSDEATTHRALARAAALHFSGAFVVIPPARS